MNLFEAIEQGQLDNKLDWIVEAVRKRKAVLGRVEPRTQEFRIYDKVKVVGKLRPNYLQGHEFVVKKVNHKTVVIDVPDDPIYRRFQGQNGVRIPKGAVQRVGD